MRVLQCTPLRRAGRTAAARDLGFVVALPHAHHGSTATRTAAASTGSSNGCRPPRAAGRGRSSPRMRGRVPHPGSRSRPPLLHWPPLLASPRWRPTPGAPDGRHAMDVTDLLLPAVFPELLLSLTLINFACCLLFLQVNILCLKDEDFNLSTKQVFDISIDFGDKNKSLGVEHSKS